MLKNWKINAFSIIDIGIAVGEEKRVWKSLQRLMEICGSNEGPAQTLVHSVTPRPSLRQPDLPT